MNEQEAFGMIYAGIRDVKSVQFRQLYRFGDCPLFTVSITYSDRGAIGEGIDLASAANEALSKIASAWLNVPPPKPTPGEVIAKAMSNYSRDIVSGFDYPSAELKLAAAIDSVIKPIE